jgi:folate-binding protein YgfZ
MITPVSNDVRARILEARDYVCISGPDAVTFLNGLVSNDVTKVGPTAAIYAALLTPQGKYLFDFFIHDISGDLILDLDLGRAPDLVKRLSLYKLRAKVTITSPSGQWATLALDDVPPNDQAAYPIVPDPRHPMLGYRWLVPAARAHELAQRFAPWPEEDYRLRMIEAEVPDHGRDLEIDKTFLMDANFDVIHGVDFKKGCYIGQELTARMKHRATARKRLVAVSIDGPLPPPGTPVMAGEREIGVMASGIQNRALALLRMDRLEENGETPLSADGRPVHVSRAP